MKEIESIYEPKIVEKKWYKTWEEGSYFTPKAGKTGKSFCVIMPPPNVTGRLHAGHALDITTQDALIRFKRMKGFETLWLPGSDHAGIATQSVVEKQLQKEEKKTKKDIGRDKFLEKVWKWKEEHGDIIVAQQKCMGASADWNYSMFTMDEGPNIAVKEAFVKLYNEGLIYRSDYIINWDPVLQSAISDAEVEHVDINGAFYHINYKIKDSDQLLEIATTRPETLLGDTAVCVHPEDERFKHLIGKKAIIPICNREVTIIADSYVDQEKGTGCLKVTPGHDFNDFDIGARHKLEIINILNKDGTINSIHPDYQGLTCKEARKKITKELKDLNLLVDVKDHLHPVGHGDRSKAIIEPMVSKQWFLNVSEMAQASVSAVEKDKTTFYPKSWENTYFSWLREPRDWCISRQLWWGHQIPVFYCNDCNHEFASKLDEKNCKKCDSKNITQDPDVLDTWFSSALWPFSTLGWPDKEKMKEKKFEKFYPSSVLITGFDIIFFWVARMMMMGQKMTGVEPFSKVYIHAIVRDKLGRKMSKSLGNGIDPIETSAEYGADAFRFTLAVGSGYNRTLNLDPERITGYRNFVNKLWNAFRFISPYLKESKENLPEFSKLDDQEKWILNELNNVAKKMNNSLEEFRFDEASNEIYSFVYEKLCSWFIELSKVTFNSNNKQAVEQRATVLRYTFKKTLALLHPITPFITEEIWSYLKNDDQDLLITSEYPEFDKKIDFESSQEKIDQLIEFITAIRNLRANLNIKPKDKINTFIKTDDKNFIQSLNHEKQAVCELAKIDQLNFLERNTMPTEKTVLTATSFSQIFVATQGVVDIKAQIARVKKSILKEEKELEKLSRKINNPKFAQNAPKEVLEEVKLKHSESSYKIKSLKSGLELLS